MAESVLVIGGAGMLGHKLAEVLAECSEFEVHSSVRQAPSCAVKPSSGRVTCHTGIDLSSGTSTIRELLRFLRPTVVLNAVGAIKQKNLASSLDETFFLNGSFPHAIALLNPNANGKVFHFSTDCVFVGDRGNHRELDKPDAQDLYGRSKIIGEIDYGHHLTVRTSIIGFELGGHLSLLSWLFRQPPGSTIRGFTNAIFSGLPTVTLSRAVRDILLNQPDLSGLYHVASEPISKYDLLRRISDRFGLDHELIPDPSVRIDRSLDDSRFRAATGTITPGWDELIEELWQDYQSGPYDRIYQQLRSQN